MFELVACPYLNLHFLVTYTHAVLIYATTLKKLAATYPERRFYILWKYKVWFKCA